MTTTPKTDATTPTSSADAFAWLAGAMHFESLLARLRQDRAVTPIDRARATAPRPVESDSDSAAA